LAGKTYSRDIFRVEGFPYKDEIEELGLFIAIVSFCVFQTHYIFIFLIDFKLLTATYFSKAHGI